MKLIVVNSNSSGNAYALDSGSEILLLEAGCKFKEVQKAIDFRTDKVVGCCISHVHGDHAKYATDFAKSGIKVYGPQDVADKKQFPYGTYTTLENGSTKVIGSFAVVPFANFHDVDIYGYLIYHPDMGTMLFSTDSYKIGTIIRGINHFLIEANYEDSILKENVRNGSISKAQSDRIMLSHMSLNYCIEYLRDCMVGSGLSATRTITLCHLSERNSDPKLFRDTVAGAFGVPTYIASKGVFIKLNKDALCPQKNSLPS